MKILIQLLVFVLITSCSTAPKLRQSKDWKKDSLKLARAFAQSYGELFPESVANQGFPKFNSKTTSFSKDLDNLTYAHAYRWKNRLERFLAIEKNPDLVTDAKIMLEFQNLEMERVELDRAIGTIPFIPASSHVLDNVRMLLRPDATQNERNSGMARFRAYVRGEENELPLIDGLTSHMLHRMKHLADNRMRGLWPTSLEIQNYLKYSELSLSELSKLLATWPGDEWKRDFEEFKLQESNYRDFLKRKVLPYARKTTLTHPKAYAFQLKESGIFKTPVELIEEGLRDYKINYKNFKQLAKKVAQKFNLPDSNPTAVIEYLKSKKPTADKDILASFNEINEILMTIVRENNLLSIKVKPDYLIRFASPSEMHIMASPYFIPAPLIEKTKTRAEFIIPRLTGVGGTDDFVYREAVFTISAHEAIPGHAVQFHIMKERKLTLVRSWLAHNSANVEGWALYAENLIYPYVEDEVKLIVLQRRLWRIARTFLDPQLNLGKISKARVKEVFVKELGFSDAFAQTEFDRYSYIMPGQAPSYYYGYRSLLNTRKEVEAKLKETFTDQCFNDAVLDLGLLPLSEVNSRLVRDLNCAGR